MINRERLLNTFLDYVRIDSESRHEAAMARRLIEDLTAIGCEVYVDNSQERTGSDTGNVIATLPGNAPGEPLQFFAHMDTVTPGVDVKPVVGEDGVIRSSGDTVLGADDKSGAAPIVEALRVVVEQDLPHPTLQAVFTVCEEIGLYGARELEYDRLQGRRAVVLDTGHPGRIVTRGPGQSLLDATVIGKSAHAGGAPEQGVSAILVLAEAISRMKLLRVDEETTANVGTFLAQFPHNIVPERAYAQIECRSRDTAKLEAHTRHLTDCLQAACDKYGARLDLKTTWPYRAYRHDDGDPFLQTIARATRAAGREPEFAPTGGGSDANYINLHGICAVIVGTGQTGAHTKQEHIAVDDLEYTTRLVLELIRTA